MDNLESIRKAFEEIKNTNSSEDVKAVAYSELMTILEKLYKLPLLEKQENKNVNAGALKLYQEISRERKL